MFDNFSASQRVTQEMIASHLQELCEEAKISRALKAAAVAQPKLWNRFLGYVGNHMISVGYKLQAQARPLAYSGSQSRSSRQVI